MYDPSHGDKQDMWLQIAKYKPEVAFSGDVMLNVTFYMQRPKSHYRTGKYKHLLKDKYKDAEYHSFKPDLDNLVKMVADVIQGKDRMIIDDSQICILLAEKKYGEPARTEVVIQEV
jgi:Holliday junction resolvase RusA-like endonuclease